MASIDGSMIPFAPTGADHDVGLTDVRPATSEVPPLGRVLGVDLGSRRIGVAASDSAQGLAVGVDTVERSSDPARDRLALAGLIGEYEAVGLVVGLPLSLDGAVGPAAAATLAEIEALRGALEVPVTMIDERLSTVAATSALRAGGRKARQQRAVVDRTAATVILQSWLERRRRPPTSGEVVDG
ncbi:MAG: Holliday junction resolvase RuvX [Actinomycetota bacterium]|nr:Holliday junction resolvase RuvX [Actinomycetota bacterium]MDQ6948010.1 Holliday junction resolvase RuvX [Actinomycetota bacterium]